MVQKARRTPGAEIVPVDSEHCASTSAWPRCTGTTDVARLLLTASGGPFRAGRPSSCARSPSPDALAHPTWSMGPKITIDSSTLMNKGLEVIEAHELFGVDYDRIDIVVHPQSIVHSMVEFRDGSTLAQLSDPDMRLPIGYALGWPDRAAAPFGALDWSSPQTLTFEPPDRAVFRCLDLAYAAGRQRRLGPGLAERGQRGRGGGVPRRRAGVERHRRRGGRDARAWARRPRRPGGRRPGGRRRGPDAGRAIVARRLTAGADGSVAAAMTLTEQEASGGRSAPRRRTAAGRQPEPVVQLLVALALIPPSSSPLAGATCCSSSPSSSSS